jgi:hypothetical protein
MGNLKLCIMPDDCSKLIFSTGILYMDGNCRLHMETLKCKGDKWLGFIFYFNQFIIAKLTDSSKTYIILRKRFIFIFCLFTANNDLQFILISILNMNNEWLGIKISKNVILLLFPPYIIYIHIYLLSFPFETNHIGNF